jgi:hypothetical protein
LPVNLEQAIIVERQVTGMDSIILLLQWAPGEGDGTVGIFAQYLAPGRYTGQAIRGTAHQAATQCGCGCLQKLAPRGA